MESIKRIYAGHTKIKWQEGKLKQKYTNFLAFRGLTNAEKVQNISQETFRKNVKKLMYFFL